MPPPNTPEELLDREQDLELERQVFDIPPRPRRDRRYSSGEAFYRHALEHPTPRAQLVRDSAILSGAMNAASAASANTGNTGNTVNTATAATAATTASASSTLPKLDWRALEYVGPYDEQLDCAICQSPLLEPRMAKCLHSFCRECFEQILLSDDRCPLDRKTFVPFEDRPGSVCSCPAPPVIINLLDNLRVRCPNPRCDHVCARSLIEHHYVRDCPYTKIRCPDAACEKLIVRHAAESARCLHIATQCAFCQKSVELASLEDHYDNSCEQNKVTCECCHAVVPKHRHTKHVASCPDRLVDCPYKSSGCASVVPRKDATEHEQSCVYGLIVRMQRKHDSDMEDVQSALAESRDKVHCLELKLAARPPHTSTGTRQQWQGSASTASAADTSSPEEAVTSDGTDGTDGTDPEDDDEELPDLLDPVTSARSSARSTFYVANDLGGTSPDGPGGQVLRQMSTEEKVHGLAADFDAINTRMENLERYVSSVDTRNTLRSMNELVPMREQIVELHNNLGLMNMRLRMMTESFRQTLRQAGTREVVDDGPARHAGPSGVSMSSMSASMAAKPEEGQRTTMNSSLFSGRRLSDRENPPRL